MPRQTPSLHRLLVWLLWRVAPAPATLPAPPLGGTWAVFRPTSARFSEPAWAVCSRRGNLGMGWIEWSPQWRAYRFRPDPEAVFNREFLAEIHKFLHDRDTA